MFVLGNFFQALAMATSYALEILTWLIIIRALLSWVSPDPYNPIVQFIEPNKAADPSKPLSKSKAWRSIHYEPGGRPSLPLNVALEKHCWVYKSVSLFLLNGNLFGMSLSSITETLFLSIAN